MSIISNILAKLTPPASRFLTIDAPGWREPYNPLRGLSTREAEDIVDNSRNGDFAQVQRIYREIERGDATLKVCVSRRKGPMSTYDLRAVSGEVSKADEQLAAEQEDALRRMVLGAENLPMAMEHLELAAFRGYSHIAPIHAPDGAIVEFDLLDSWNISRRGAKGPWLWNPESKSGLDGLAEIPADETIFAEDDAIDYPALFFYIAKALGIRDWGRFVERFGIPPCAITMPNFATEEDQQKYLRTAAAMRRGQDAALPFGTVFSWGSEARGIEPFSKLIQFLIEQVVLMATGGLLTSLAAPGSGTLAGGAHEDTWNQVTKRSRRVNANALFAGAGRPALKRLFPGRPILAKLEYDDEPRQTAGEFLDDAIKVKAAGFALSAEEASRRTGYELTPAPEPPPAPGFPPFGGASRFANSQNAGNAAGKARENAGRTQNASEEGAEAPTPSGAVLKDLKAAREKDFAPIAGAIDRLLSLDGADLATKAKALAANLPAAIPSMNAAAEVLEREMAGAFVAEGERLQNEFDESKHPRDDKGKFGEGGGETNNTEKFNREAEEIIKKTSYSEKTQTLLDSADNPKNIDPSDADHMLKEGFHVKSAKGDPVVFGSRLSHHLNDGHSRQDVNGRKAKLLFAVDTVKTSAPAIGDRNSDNTAYAKIYGNRLITVVADNKGVVDNVFNIVIRKAKGEKAQ